jgi:hypothetical protein
MVQQSTETMTVTSNSRLKKCKLKLIFTLLIEIGNLSLWIYYLLSSLSVIITRKIKLFTCGLFKLVENLVMGTEKYFFFLFLRNDKHINNFFNSSVWPMAMWCSVALLDVIAQWSRSSTKSNPSWPLKRPKTT